MHVAVLGGGLQGCCIALALADRGVRVSLFDRNERLLTRAAVANEGKIHLGYMYGGDPSLNTARTMMRGALAFAPFVSRHLGMPLDGFALSSPAVYLVHRDSQHGVDELSGYLSAVHDLIAELAPLPRSDYFGRDLRPVPRRWSEPERTAAFDPHDILAAFDTPEVAVDPIGLADRIRARIEAEPLIEVLTGHTVTAVEAAGERLRVRCEDGVAVEFDQVANALWDGRLAIDATLGLSPGRPWLHRLKYGVTFRPPAHLPRPTSVTVVSGPFGEVVNYADGLIYLTWYPHCLKAFSTEAAAPVWPIYPAEPLRSQILEGTFAALSRIVPALSAYPVGSLAELTVRGGPIVAWGATDIYDPHSELHRRFEIGVTSLGRYHTVDPGKLTMAPYFATVCASRIAGDA